MPVPARFDELVHAPNRLRICALLATATSAEFGTIRDALGVADSVTSKQLKILADAGYVTISKTHRYRRQGQDLGDSHARPAARHSMATRWRCSS